MSPLYDLILHRKGVLLTETVQVAVPTVSIFTNCTKLWP